MEFIPPIVVDCGYDTSRIGRAGEDNPQFVVPSQLGILQSSSDPIVGMKELSEYAEGLTLKPFMNQEGFISDYDTFEKIFGTVHKKLINSSSSNSIFLTEPAIHWKENRVKLAEMMFERFDFHQMFICKSPVLSSFSCGKSTCLVFDSGECNSSAVPVHDGYIVQNTIFNSKVAGNVLTEACHRFLKSQNLEVIPEWMLKTIIKDGRMAKEKQELEGFTESAYNFHVNKILKRMKIDVLECYPESIAKKEGAYQFNSKFYALPDGSAIEIKGDQYKIPEMVFISEDQKQEENKSEQNDAEMMEEDGYQKKLEGFIGFQNLVMKAINASDMDIRKDLYKNILCTGGTTQIKNFEKRFQKEIEEVAPQNSTVGIITKTKMPIPGVDNDDYYSSWIGASILSSLGSFKSMWFTKSEYEEHGVNYIERKCS